MPLRFCRGESPDHLRGNAHPRRSLALPTLPPRHFRSAAGVARTWLPGWQPERPERPERPALRVPKPAVAVLPLGSSGLVPQLAPLPREPRVLRVRVALLAPQQVARNPAPQAQPNWRVGALLAAWHRAQARP
jgi:hypothetical protein